MPPTKRARQPKMTTQSLLDFDLGESSSDSDFRIEDHCSDGSKDGGSEDDVSSSSGDSDSDNEDEEECNSEDSTLQLKQLLQDDHSGELIMNGDMNGTDAVDKKLKELASKTNVQHVTIMKLICCVCLGERSDDSNEIVECDGCGVSVHEGCYGVSDNMSISSTNSTCSTEPWFCEACRAGVAEPSCELCPNKGGIYKETDVGKWVHLICALYVPGVAFGEVEQLSSVTLFEMQYSKWGAKMCSLCENSLFARCGVCIGCDAGMCKTFFHVTCAQAAGFLIEAHHEDADAADPFYAHCKVHSEKEMIRKRKRNYQTLRLYMQQKIIERVTLKLDDPSPAQMRIHRKLLKIQNKYATQKLLKPDPWVPTQKMSRLLTTSASACKRLLAKAAVISVDVKLMERQEAQIAALTDIRKKWHIAPAFSVEFVAYYMDRISRISDIKQQLNNMMTTNVELNKEQEKLRSEYDEALEDLKNLKSDRESLVSRISAIHKAIITLYPNKIVHNPENIGRPKPNEPHKPHKASPPPQRPISVPTAAALKMGVGFPLAHLGTKVDATRMLSTHAKGSPNSSSISSPVPVTPLLRAAPTNITTQQTCGICKLCSDQHLLAKCDTCKLHYHLGCLNPPLTRHPKKSKQYGWQCSECCDKSDISDSVVEVPQGRRKSRTRYSQEGFILSSGCESILGKRYSLDVETPNFMGSKNSPLQKIASKASLTNTDILIEGKSEAKKFKSSLKSQSSKITLSNTPQSTAKQTESLESTIQTTYATGMLGSSDVNNSDPLALPTVSNLNASLSALDDSFDSSSKLSRKHKRRERHKNKHISSSDTEKSPNKEHKRKRKKKHEEQLIEQPGCIPKIKIKFKTLPLPGEDTPEAQFFYVSADAVRSAEEASRPTSVETVEEVALSVDAAHSQTSNIAEAHEKPILPMSLASPVVQVSARKSSPRKSNVSRQRSVMAKPVLDINCCVCGLCAKNNQVVTCDECRKNYHFTCLDPPLKKTPKIRGYSWICADCDPTDEERK